MGIAPAAAGLHGKLYIFGGCNAGVEDLSSAEVFDPSVGFWRSLPRMPAARRLCTAAAMEGKIYVFGRAASSVSEPIGLCFRPDTGKWEVLPHMPSAALPCVAVASLGRLYLF